ncbi:MAG: hypothetical protein AB1384_09830 [Actinomycetota bacterium]
MAEVRFDVNDAWLFWAIPTDEEGTDLRGMIGAADAVNHAIPSREQVVRTVNRGLRSGIIEASGSRFRFAPGIRDEIAAASSVSTTWMKQWDAIYDFLSSREWPPAGKGAYRLSEARYQKTVEDYLKSF